MKPRLVTPPDRPPTQREIDDACPLEIPPSGMRRMVLLVLIEVVMVFIAAGIVLWSELS